MKKILSFIACFVFLLTWVTFVNAQVTGVYKSTATATLNEITGNIVIPSGKSLTFASGSTFTNNATTSAFGGNITVSGAGTSAFAGRIRVTGWESAGTGSGLELGWDSTNVRVLAYNRTGSLFLPMALEALSYGISASGVTAITIGTSGAVALKGTATNDNAATGCVGEYLTATKLVGSAVSMTSTNPAEVLSISLTAGDWDVTGVCNFSNNASTTVSYQYAGLGTTSASLGTQGDGTNTGRPYPTGTVFPTALDNAYVLPVVRFSLSATTTIYLNAQTAFGVSTSATYGFIRARRVR